MYSLKLSFIILAVISKSTFGISMFSSSSSTFVIVSFNSGLFFILMFTLNLSALVNCSGRLTSTTSSLFVTLASVIYPSSLKSTSISGFIASVWYLAAGLNSVIVYFTVLLNPLLSKSAIPIPVSYTHLRAHETTVEI